MTLTGTLNYIIEQEFQIYLIKKKGIVHSPLLDIELNFCIIFKFSILDIYFEPGSRLYFNFQI